MEIRSITLFCDPEFEAGRARRFFASAQSAFSVKLQTRRAALPPFPDWWDASRGTAEETNRIAEKWLAAGADYLSLGPVKLNHDISWLNRLASMLGVADVVFGAAEIADVGGNINTGRCASIARLIQQNSRLRANGFGNLYFAALANCPPGSPFFPVAYHAGGAADFALAIEGADLALQAVQGASTLDEARQGLISRIEHAATLLVQECERLADAHDIPFRGLDFSLAPFPTEECSLGGALESLGLPWLGAAGSLFAAAFVAEALGRADFPRCGFSNLMLPVLEDKTLADLAAAGRLTMADLLNWAAVCGAGLDTVPLPGDVSVTQLAAILLDVAALAARLDKPLTARLLPMPGLEAGDLVSFEFPYFADSAVIPVVGAGVTGLMQIPTTLEMESRARQRPR